MKLGNRQHVDRAIDMQVSMTSMIDVVFLLLIFFLVTTTFVKPERHLTSNIVVEHLDAGIRLSDLEPAVVEVFRRGETVIFQIGGRQSSKLDELQPILVDYENKSDGGFVRVGPDVPFERAVEVIGALKSSGFSVVSYVSASDHE
jgi:biopolymer transport protein ExbD